MRVSQMKSHKPTKVKSISMFNKVTSDEPIFNKNYFDKSFLTAHATDGKDEEETLKEAAVAILISYCEVDMVDELREELAAEYNQECFNGLKFRLAAAVIKLDKSECLEVILKSLINVKSDALERARDLRALAVSHGAKNCQDLLNGYTFNTESSRFYFAGKVVFISRPGQLESENPFKFQCGAEALKIDILIGGNGKPFKPKLS